MSFHLYTINELYSNADGSIQFIEMTVGNANGEGLWAGHTISVSQTAASPQPDPGYTTPVYAYSMEPVVIQDVSSHSLTFPTNLPSSATANTKVLIATQGFADLGKVTPDFIIPAGFLFTSGGTVDYAGVDSFTYTALPTDGSTSLSRNGTTGPATPTDFAGATATLSPVTAGTAVQGTTANDTLRGGAGNDTIDGGTGINAAAYTGSLSSFTLTPNSNGTWTAKDNSGAEGTDTLSHIAKLQFANGTVQLAADLTSSTPDGSATHSLAEIDDSIGQRMEQFYLAYYGRAADYGGLVYWKQNLASALANDQTRMVSSFGNASQTEFVNLYGTGNDNTAFLNAVYQNLFSHGPDSGGLNYWLGVINSAVAGGTALEAARANAVIYILDGALDGTHPADAAIVNAKLASMTTLSKLIATYDQSNAFGDANNSTAFTVERNWTQAQLPGTTAPDLVLKAVSEKIIANAAVGGNEVQTSASYTLPTGFTNLKLTGTTGLTGTGNVADNLIFGNSAGSTLTGGSGNDCFVVSTLTGTPDRVTDFAAGDLIAVDTAGFSGLKAGVQTVQAAGSVTGTAATLVYDQASGTLYFDADGEGSQAPQAILTLTGAPALSAGNVWGI